MTPVFGSLVANNIGVSSSSCFKFRIYQLNSIADIVKMILMFLITSSSVVANQSSENSESSKLTVTITFIVQ